MTSHPTQTLRFVVEGIGDVSEKRYAPALEELKNDLQKTCQINVTFTDYSEYWKNDSSLAPRRRTTIDQIKGWGADYLDKSNSNDFKMYQSLQTDFVFVATPDRTHTEVAETWLKKDPRPVIFIEKPLEADLNAARRLLGQIRPYDERVIAFDHYRARMLLSKSQLEHGKRILEVLGDMRYPILEIKNQGRNLPTYPSGMQGKRESPYLEDLLEGGAYELSLLYGG